jgi:hypothetical protein
MINESKPTTSITNSTQPNRGETWASITTTWANETRTWNQTGGIMTNQSSPLYQYLLLETGGFFLTEDMQRILIGNSSLITNVARPS